MQGIYLRWMRRKWKQICNKGRMWIAMFRYLPSWIIYKWYPIVKDRKMFRASDIFSHLRTMSLFNLARACCKAMEPPCLACSLGISVDEYCMDNPLMSGCEKGNIYEMTNCWLVSQYQEYLKWQIFMWSSICAFLFWYMQGIQRLSKCATNR